MGVPFLRQQIGTVAELVAWARSAAPRDAVTYHIGNLVADRARVVGLHDLAETVLLLQDTGFLVGQQVPIRLVATSGSHYLAIRTGGGWMPRSIAEQRVDATLYRALQALRARDCNVSAQRMVRNALSLSDAVALDVMTRLAALGLIEEAPQRGWQLTAQGARMLS